MYHTPIYQALVDLEGKHRTPFHMPGHKRKPMDIFEDRMLYSYDITEISDYDNLHHPEGIIRESMDQLKEIYQTKESWYVINGSTAGILASIASCVDVGDRIILGRNCHKSVYNMVRLLHLDPIYLYPEFSETYQMMLGIGENERSRLQDILKEYDNVKAVFITSPTYEGVVSDIRSIKDILEPYHIPLIVDEAHGAHLVYMDSPKSAISCGADLVIQSAHKTLPAPTQTALLHLCSDLVDRGRVEENLSVFQTSSPSYLMLAATEYAIAYMKNSVDKIEEYKRNIHNFRRKCEQLRQIHLIEKADVDCFDYDDGKLVFSVANTSMDGHQLFDRMLSEYGIEFEMANISYGLAMTSICDEESDFEKLWEAIYAIDQDLERSHIRTKTEGSSLPDFRKLEKVFSPWECPTFTKKRVALEDAVGCVAAEFVQLYPPDIPILVPGEKIHEEIVENISYYIYNGYNVLGVESGTVMVID